MTPKLAIMTGTRAEYGILRPLILALRDRGRPVELYVTGSHLAAEHGMTVGEIEADGVEITERLDIGLSGDSPTDVGRVMGAALAAFAETLSRRKPDLLFILGDRFEALAAAAAAQLARVPVAHLHGGERTEGAVDEAFRHSITKMSRLHFVAADEYGRRVQQLGEDASNVFVVGALGLDNIARTQWLSRDELEAQLDFRFRERNLLVTHHPLTLDLDRSRQDFSALLTALDAFTDAGIIITMPNADTGGAQIREMIESFCSRRPQTVRSVVSLGTQRYFSLLREVDAVVGNSSSGLIEAPSFGIGTVNIGDRQKGRLAGPTVVTAEAEPTAIETAITRVLSENFRRAARAAVNPYGDGRTAERICQIVDGLSFPLSLQKSFVDLAPDAYQ